MELFTPNYDLPYAAQSVSYTATAGSTDGWPAGPQGVLVWSTTACRVVVGNGVTASATLGAIIPPNCPIPFRVPINDTGGIWRVSAIRIADNGVVYATPMNR